MDDKRLWFLLSELAARLDIEVRVEPLAAEDEYAVRGGLCWLRGRPVIFVERRQEPSQRCRQLGLALQGLALEGVYLRPAVREYLDGLASETARPGEGED
ncbi:MAG: hypothetical protein C4525_12045 [Desulfarculus sp.]|jgi:hypothetical protein|nr:MAG: hypothetical protein C4525_12045 [Desulfarculus sp.]